MKKKRVWFKAKKYGWGWTPASWQGWLLIVFYVGITIWNFIRIDSHSHSVSDTLINFVPETVLTAIVLVIVAYWKGEKPHWRWGEKDYDD